MMLLFHWTFMPVSLNRVSYTEPVQTISWEVLVQGIKCCSCDPHKGCCIYIYNCSLSRQSEPITDVRSQVNIRYLLTPEKAIIMKTTT